MTDPGPEGSARDVRIVAAIESMGSELLAFSADLIRFATVNPPGEQYEACAQRIASELARLKFAVETIPAIGRPEHTVEHPRPNVLGVLGEPGARPCVHLNGHFDVVPPGEGWTRDPFGGTIEDGRLYGRGSADMKAGLAAAMYAAAAVAQADALGSGRVEVSGTVDEESGGFAGVRYLAEKGVISADRTDHVIIPEPFGVERICVGHRGVYWFKVTALGRIGHGSMPFLGRSAIDDLTVVLEKIRTELAPAIAARSTTMPVVPPQAQKGSVNVNSVAGGQVGGSGALGNPVQTPCVADRAEAVVDRRFLPEESFESVRAEITDLLARARAEDPERSYELEDLLVVHPTRTPEGSPVVKALSAAIRQVVGSEARLVASPGTYDQKHVARVAGVTDCVAYGPGELRQAHQPDEFCSVEDIVRSAKVMALAIARLLEPTAS